jgi:hypothetical protein
MSFAAALKDRCTIARLVSPVRVTLKQLEPGDALTVNGVTLTAAVASDYEHHKFNSTGSDLVTLINHSQYGIDGILAQYTNSAVNIFTLSPGSPVTVSSGSPRITITTTDYGKPLAPVWITVAEDVPCHLRATGAAELFAQTTTDKVRATLFLLYGTSVIEGDRITVDNVVYYVQYVDADVGGARHHMEILLSEVR